MIEMPLAPADNQPDATRMASNHPQDVRVENALLRGELFLTARALKYFLDSPHKKIEVGGESMMEITVPQSLYDKARDALNRADRRLKNEERHR